MYLRSLFYAKTIFQISEFHVDEFIFKSYLNFYISLLLSGCISSLVQAVKSQVKIKISPCSDLKALCLWVVFTSLGCDYPAIYVKVPRLLTPRIEPVVQGTISVIGHLNHP